DVQEFDFTVECANPSMHQFRFDSELSPALAAFMDTDPTNNTNTAIGNTPVTANADLAIVGWDFSELDAAGLGDLLVGEDFLFSTTKTLHNFGDTVNNAYMNAVDATVTKAIVVPEGLRTIIAVGTDEAPATVTIQR